MNHHPLHVLTALLLAAAPGSAAAAAPVYTQDFEGVSSLPAGFSTGTGKAFDAAAGTDGGGNYNGETLETNGANFFNGTQGLYLETDGQGAYFVFNSADTASPITVATGDTVTVTFDLDVNSGTYGGDIPFRLDTIGADGAFNLGFASRTFTSSDAGVGRTVTGTVTTPGSLGFAVDLPGGNDYAQVEFDNLSVEVTPVPEPGSLALLGLGGLALLRRARR